MSSSALHERVVRYMSEEERTACTLLAVLGQWTQKQALAFAQAAGIPLSPLLLERLCGFSFIFTQDGVTFHMMRQVGEVLRQDCTAALSGTRLEHKSGLQYRSRRGHTGISTDPERVVAPGTIKNAGDTPAFFCLSRNPDMHQA